MPKHISKMETADVPHMVLPSHDGTPLISFPLKVIHPIRRLISRLDSKGEIPPRLAITSALRGEGASYISWAYATSMAFDLETTVCIVDLNWWWPSDIFPKDPGSGGLGSVLSGDNLLDRVVKPTGKPNLAYLPSGNIPADERAYFARSAVLKETILELNSLYDRLVLDIPAVLACNDAIPLASLATAFLMVIRQNTTSIEEARSALNDLDHLPNLGVVMNKYRFDMPKFVQKFIINPQSV